MRVVDIIRPPSTPVHKCCVSFSQRITVQAWKSRADSHVQDWTFVSMYRNPMDYILWLFDKILWYYVVTTHPACKVILGSPQWANSWVCAAFLILWGNLGKTVISRIADLEKKIGMAFVELHKQLKWKKTLTFACLTCLLLCCSGRQLICDVSRRSDQNTSMSDFFGFFFLSPSLTTLTMCSVMLTHHHKAKEEWCWSCQVEQWIHLQYVLVNNVQRHDDDDSNQWNSERQIYNTSKPW